AQAHGALGQALRDSGRFAEASASMRRSLQLLPAVHPLRQITSQQLQLCDNLFALGKKLPDILEGKQKPRDAAELLALAELCARYKKRYAAAARFYAAASSAEPKLADDLRHPHRYNAACSALLAAAGQGEDARLLPNMEVLMFRRQALGWLRAELAAY